MEPTTAAAEYTDVTLATYSLFQVGLVILVGLPLAIFMGFWTGRLRRRRLIERGMGVERLLGETAQGAFLGLVGLLLAFSYGNSLSIAQSMKDAATNEAAAIGTAFLRTDYLDEPGRTELKFAILEYARTRLLPTGELINTPEELHVWLETSLEAQGKLWPTTLSVTRGVAPPPTQSFVAGAINEAIDAHLYRVATQTVPLAPFSQAIVLLATVAAIFLLANRTALLGRSLTWRMWPAAGFVDTGLGLHSAVLERHGAKIAQL
ncbi:hypothetical protein R5H30_18110 [Sulfitobacter sp. D35]|uniref:hypothetical protein n=1 Tax=Sulfitobacter sp. D35 TaxID=3083252 RepID=UPI00296F73FB|nr:hypothetical protein [Sulfitobacter sp. D35]MDW4499913.1 hypothetical protein [Sulfitobacter sp. D35]